MKSTIIHSLITSFGTIINGLLGLLFYIVIARGLGPEFFGVFSICIAILTVLADISNIGIDTGLIRFIPKYKFGGNKAYLKYLKLGLEIKGLIWLIVAIISWVLIPFFAESVFLKPQLIVPLRLAVLGVLGAMLFSFITSALQALEKYISWSALNISMNGLRLMLILILMVVFTLNLNNTLIIYIITPLMGFLIGLLLLPKFITVSNEWSVAAEFFHYNKWIAMTTLISAISSRLDTFLTARFLSVAEIGVYSAANQLTQVIPQLTFALAVVVAPKLASFKDHRVALNYLKKLQLLTLGLAFLVVLSLPILSLLIPIIFGASYINSINPFLVLVIAQLIFFIAIPSQQAIFYYFGKPNFLTIVNLINFLIMLIIGLSLIPIYRINGAALVILIGNLVSLIASLGFVSYQFNKAKR